MKTKELKKYSVQVLMMTVTYMISMLLPILFSYLIDDILIMGKGDELWGWFGITFLVAILSMVCKFLFCQYLPVKIGIRNTFKLQIKSAENIMGMNQSIYAKKDKGYYYNLCSNSCGSYGDLHEEIHLKLVSELLYIFGILAVITYVNRFFGVFFAVYGMILVLISLYSARPLYGLQKDSMSVQDKYLGGIRNIIENKGGINAIHTESFFKKKFVACVDEYEKFILKFRFWNYLCAYLPDIVNQIFNVAYLFVAALLVFRGDITTGILLMGYQYLGYFSSPISTVCSILMRYKANKIHIERVDELTEDAQKERENTTYKTEQNYVCRAKEFDFYKGAQEEDFLYHIEQLELKKNGLYVIKGENGSGKSMLMNLMLGNISIQDSKGNFTVAQDIENTSFLTYPFFAVDGSFVDNLFGIPKDEALMELLHVDFETKEIKSNPVNLSYGQQQKLALLRTFGADKPYLFLDEPLSNLDIGTQSEVIAYIKSLKGKKTILMIMHSDELDSDADGVIYIEDRKLYMKQKEA